MEETIIQMNGGTMINVDVSVKNVMYGKNIMFGIFLHVIVKMESIQKLLWMKYLEAIICDEVIDSSRPRNKF